MRKTRRLSVSHDCDADLNAIVAPDNLSRRVYCILGLPIDTIDMSTVVRRIVAAASSPIPYVISTPNLNFLVSSLKDDEFRESLLLSDLCPPDGMPIVWIARLMGIPIRQRIAGSDIFTTLQTSFRYQRVLKVFLFGATEKVAGAAARTLNANTALECIGWICPGFGTVDELSQDRYIDEINSSKADFLVIALNAKKGQLWLLRNHHKLSVPVRAQLGATINFQAGTVKRAPRVLQKLGFEWLWRIGQEPQLWRRYARDGGVFLRLLLTQVLPLAFKARSLRHKAKRDNLTLILGQTETPDSVIVSLCGFAIDSEVEKATAIFRKALALNKPIEIDFSETREIDPRFMGLILMLRKQIRSRGGFGARFSGVNKEIEKTFRLNGLEYFLRESRESADTIKRH
jgi:N-acetylglucosaminyldiphosphoundecaprenol N-acetyl-beta-D-mannosaminyltransferase